ncbi:MAG TPA: hypothetical protein VK527_05810 [Candidatus Limnocylindrales bacterium]|nr:hypothetical protein [Candidatus Limnocylindrales bacterium]
MTTLLDSPRPFLRAAVGAICTIALSAALSDGAAGAEENSLHAGATSVQFLVLGGSGSGPPAFGTSGIFVKTHLSDRGALRVGADLYLNESTAKPGQLRRAENNRYYAVSVSAEFEEYVDATGPVTVFFGVGPYWTRYRSSTEYINMDLSDPAYVFYSNYERRTWEVGGAAAVGFEWFFKRRLSMIGRAGASVGFGKRNDYEQHTSTYPTYQNQEYRFESTTATAASSSAAIGLALYF